MPDLVTSSNIFRGQKGKGASRRKPEQRKRQRRTMLGRRPDTTEKNKKCAKENVITGQKYSLIRMSHEPQRGRDIRPGRAEQNKNTMKSFFFRDVCVAYVYEAQTCFQTSNYLLKGVFKVKFAVSICDSAHRYSSTQWKIDSFLLT